MAARTRARVLALTLGLSFSTRDTVPVPTPARAATSAIVTIPPPVLVWKRFHGGGVTLRTACPAVNEAVGPYARWIWLGSSGRARTTRLRPSPLAAYSAASARATAP